MQDAPQSGDHVIVLIAAPGKAELSDDVLAQAIGAVAMFMPELRWLNEPARTAAEVAFTPPPPSHFTPRSLESRLRGRLMGLPIDIAVLPLGGRRRKLILTDLPADTPGADILAATMRAHGGAVRFALPSLPAGLPPPQEVLAATRDETALPLFDAASLKVAFHAGAAVAQAADARIMHNDLTALLHLQGYTAQQFSPRGE